MFLNWVPKSSSHRRSQTDDAWIVNKDVRPDWGRSQLTLIQRQVEKKIRLPVWRLPQSLRCQS